MWQWTPQLKQFVQQADLTGDFVWFCWVGLGLPSGSIELRKFDIHWMKLWEFDTSLPEVQHFPSLHLSQICAATLLQRLTLRVWEVIICDATSGHRKLMEIVLWPSMACMTIQIRSWIYCIDEMMHECMSIVFSNQSDFHFNAARFQWEANTNETHRVGTTSPWTSTVRRLRASSCFCLACVQHAAVGSAKNSGCVRPSNSW